MGSVEFQRPESMESIAGNAVSHEAGNFFLETPLALLNGRRFWVGNLPDRIKP